MHTRRQEVKLLRRPAITGPHARCKWNADVTVNKPLCVRQSAQLLDHDRSNHAYNYRAERLPSSAPVDRDAFGRITACSLKQTARAAELEVHESLRSKPAWNDTTAFGGERERAGLTAALDRRAQRRTAIRRAALGGYVGPVERERQRMRLLRAQRAAVATAALEASSEFGGAGADSKAIAAMAASGLSVFPPVSAEHKGKAAFGIAMATATTEAVSL